MELIQSLDNSILKYEKYLNAGVGLLVACAFKKFGFKTKQAIIAGSVATAAIFAFDNFFKGENNILFPLAKMGFIATLISAKMAYSMVRRSLKVMCCLAQAVSLIALVTMAAAYIHFR